MTKCAILGASLILAAAASAQPVQWRVGDGGNGHWYEYHASGFIDFDEKLEEARALGGDLASVESAAENQFVATILVAAGPPCRVALGARRSCTECPWTWVDGRPWGFTSWAPNEPGNPGAVHAEMIVASGPVGMWADVADPDTSCTGYVIEWSADCNNDGIVDKGQILSGQLVDANANGVPDACEPPICSFWSLESSPSLPPPRHEFSMAFDEARGEIVLFGGGGTGPGTNGVWGDTWIFGAGVWRQYNGGGPSPRIGASLAFDRNSQRLVLFGGRSADDVFLNDTWEWTGAGWVLRATGGVPPRMNAGMAFDSDRNTLVLAGGSVFASNWVRRSDVYEWNGNEWTQAGNLPAAIGGMGLAFDAVRREMVLFGGALDDGSANGATYVRRGTNWSVASHTGPAAVANLGMCWVEQLGRVLVFGGTRGNPDGEIDSCWTWDGATWSPLADAGRPSRRQTMGFVYDSSRERAVSVFGWLNNTNTYMPEQWELSFSTLELTSHPTSVAANHGQAAGFSCAASDANATFLWHRNNTPLSNNGHISGADTATLSISNTQWSDQGAYTCLVSGNCGSVMSEAATLTVTSCPPSWASFGTADFGARWVHAQAYSGVNGGTLLFGGRDAANTTRADTWLRTSTGWANVSNTGPAARTDHAMAKLSNGRVLLFGGKTSASLDNSALGDTWEWDGSQWSLLSTTGPQARGGHAMCFDAARNRVVLFGGLDLNGVGLADTWEWNGSAWTQIPSIGPAARFAHTMAYEPARRRTLLFGGFRTGLLGDTWEWDGATWTQVATTGVSARFYAAADFDEHLGRILLFGGSTGGSVLGDGYIWTGTSWQPRSFGTSPTARWTHAMSYDAAAQRMVITGGAGSGATRFADSWEQSGRAIVTSQPPAAMSRMAGDSVQLATTVGGSGPFTYRWKKGGANLFNSALYSGVTTPTLTINTTDPSQSGLYALTITSPCTAFTTPGTALEVYCGADWNNDGGVDGDDVIAFMFLWDAGDAGADFNGDGGVDGDDAIEFFGRWDAGC